LQKMTLENLIGNIFENTNGWLRFAEAKNATLLALDGAALAIASQVIADSWTNNWTILTVYLGNLTIFLLLAIVTALLSFLPHLSPPGQQITTKEPNQPNPLFFGDAVTLDPDALINRLSDLAGPRTTDYGNLSKFYADQIITNSKLTVRKLIHFQIAIWFTLAGILSPLGAMLVFILDRWIRRSK